jgi:hypothetical protein
VDLILFVITVSEFVIIAIIIAKLDCIFAFNNVDKVNPNHQPSPNNVNIIFGPFELYFGFV